MTLRKVLERTAQGQMVHILNANTGELLIEDFDAYTVICLFEDTFMFPGEWYYAEVMGVWVDRIRANTLVLCIDV